MEIQVCNLFFSKKELDMMRNTFWHSYYTITQNRNNDLRLNMIKQIFQWSYQCIFNIFRLGKKKPRSLGGVTASNVSNIFKEILD
jgi:hypothetical protein